MNEPNQEGVHREDTHHRSDVQRVGARGHGRGVVVGSDQAVTDLDRTEYAVNRMTYDPCAAEEVSAILRGARDDEVKAFHQ